MSIQQNQDINIAVTMNGLLRFPPSNRVTWRDASFLKQNFSGRVK